MAIEIRKTNDISVTGRGIKLAVYGGAGIGKTRLSATAPNPLIISAESGLLSLKDSATDYIAIKIKRTLMMHINL